MSGYILYGGGPTRSMMTEMVFAEGAISYEFREIDPLEHRLAASGPHFLGASFSLADLTFLYWMAYVEDWCDLGGFPATIRALEIARERPALTAIFARQAAWIARLKR